MLTIDRYWQMIDNSDLLTLTGGAVIQGVTTDLSSGGAMIRMERDFIATLGASLSTSDPIQFAIIAFAIICMLSGFALGADLALPPSLLGKADHCSDSEVTRPCNHSVCTLKSKRDAGNVMGDVPPIC